MNQYISEFGNEWQPAILDTEEEYDFIREGQKSFSNSVPYWIGGSTDSNDTVEYNDYIADSSGTVHRQMRNMCHRTMTFLHWSESGCQSSGLGNWLSTWDMHYGSPMLILAKPMLWENFLILHMHRMDPSKISLKKVFAIVQSICLWSLSHQHLSSSLAEASTLDYTEHSPHGWSIVVFI